jgi:hypothetical protein
LYSKKHPDIIGLILAGSRGKHFETTHSDYDVIVVTRNIDKQNMLLPERGALDVELFTLAELLTYADFGTGREWDRYTFAHLRAIIDKEGGVQPIIDSKETIPAQFRTPILQSNLEAYINLYHRSIKNRRDGRHLASHLDAVESLAPLLTALFALNSRVRPYNKYLEWELTMHPLAQTMGSVDQFLSMISTIIATADRRAQVKLFGMAKNLFASDLACTQVLEGWRGYYLG